MKTKYRNVIIIGCDKTGKSTLIEGLREAEEVQVREYEFFKGNKMPTPEDAHNAAVERVRYNLQNDANTIYDRFHFPDDIVYHPVTNGEALSQDIVNAYFRDVFPYLKGTNTLIIYCAAPAGVIAERFIQEREELIDVSAIQHLLDNYRYALEFLTDHFEILMLDSSVLTANEMLWAALNEIVGGDVQ